MLKNEAIRASLKATKEKRKSQTCKVYRTKLDRSHLNRSTTEHLRMLFLEAKWLYNFILSQNRPFELDYKIREVPVKVKSGFEIRRIARLSSQMKQELVSRTVDNIRGLARLRAKGNRIGRLKFKSEVRSIPLKQYGCTHKILDGKYIRIQGIKQKLKARGLEQIPKGADVANGTLMHRNGDYYLLVTTYQTRDNQVANNGCIGIDFGLDNQLALSDGTAVKYSISISKKLRRLHRKLSRRSLHSKNWNRIRIKLDREYSRSADIKKDIKNKIVNYLKNGYGIVCYQNENIKAWQRIWGKKILYTSIVGIISALRQKAHTPIEVDRFYPSTKTCSICGNIQEIRLDERVYVCRSCGSVIDRDLNASTNIRNEGLRKIGTVRTESTPVEIGTHTLASLEYLNSIPYVKASSVYESGSLTALA